VAASIVVQTVTAPGETPELLTLAGASDLIAGVAGWADLTAPTSPTASLRWPRDQAEASWSAPPPGPARSRSRLLVRPDVRRGLAAVAAAGLAYDLVITAGQLGAADRAAAALPACGSSSTTWLSRRSPRAKPSRGPGTCGPWPRCRTPRASCPAW
jgi:L-fuconolactonase